MAQGEQIALFGHEEPACDEAFLCVERVTLGDGAWLEIARGWLRGDAALFEALRSRAVWREDSRTMYERKVTVPRLLAALDSAPPHPVVARMRAALNARYDVDFARGSAALYRDGRDSVAWHGDTVAREMLTDTVVATVSLGAPRTFLVRRKGGGPSRAWSLGRGDLCVMGGTSQRTHEHAIPKVGVAAPRIALMYRPVWETEAASRDPAKTPTPASPRARAR